MHEDRTQFTLEITTSALCNLDCTYCFEGAKTNKQRLDDKIDVLKQRVRELYESEFYKTNYNHLNISFWGGEPTLNQNLIIDIMKEFQHHDDIAFHIYTNAYNRKRLDDIVEAVDLSKLHVQISYDGREINDKFRILSTGKPTSASVLENMEYFAKKGVSLSLKSTVPLKSMHSLYNTWMDFKNLFDSMNDIGPNIRISYAPTIDYVDELPRDQAEELVKVFREQMLRVAAEEIKFYKEHNQFLCTWFNGSDTKTHCSAGAHMHAIDVDGNSYACHGALYSPNKQDLHGGNIVDDSFINSIEQMSKKYAVSTERVSDTCKNCVATTCMICPVASFDMSKNEDHFDRWTDRWVNNMCGFFKAFGEIDRTVQAHIEGEL